MDGKSIVPVYRGTERVHIRKRDESLLSFAVIVSPAVKDVIEFSRRSLDHIRRIGLFCGILAVSDVLRRVQKSYAVFRHEVHLVIVVYRDIYRVHRDILSNVEPIGAVPALEDVLVFRSRAFLESATRLNSRGSVFYLLQVAESVAVIESYREFSEGLFVFRNLVDLSDYGRALLSIPAFESIIVFFVAVTCDGFGQLHGIAVSKIALINHVFSRLVLSNEHHVVTPDRFFVNSGDGKRAFYLLPILFVPACESVIILRVARLGDLLFRRLRRGRTVSDVLRFYEPVAVFVHKVYRIYPDNRVISRDHRKLSRDAGEILVPARKNVMVLLVFDL